METAGVERTARFRDSATWVNHAAGIWLREQRRERGLTQTQLADELAGAIGGEVGISTVAGWESAKRFVPAAVVVHMLTRLNDPLGAMAGFLALVAQGPPLDVQEELARARAEVAALQDELSRLQGERANHA